MSDKYERYCAARETVEKDLAIFAEIVTKMERDLERMRAEYSLACDHPTRVLQYPVCGICYKFCEPCVKRQ